MSGFTIQRHMSQQRRAVIDIGTNSIKLLVADVTGRHVEPLWEESKQTRLGRGFYETHLLQPEPIEKTARAVAKFAAVAREWRAESVRVIATSAARDAKNPHDLTAAIESESGLKVEIISGEQEADWAFRGVTSDPELTKHPLLLLEVGGGSTEFILGHGHRKHFAHSFPLGTVRLMENFPHSDPPAAKELAACREWIGDFLRIQLRPKLAAELSREAKFDPVRPQAQLVGAGGTTSILARMELEMPSYNRGRIEATRLSLDRVRWHLNRLWRMPLEQRREIIGLPKKRADVILPGVAIYEVVMTEFGFADLRVSTRGLRFAAVMDGA
jgi:exopolyphosphatase/guanosine-5'-triphosphate,3'-diphosphate pyrophosphatase